MKIPRFLQAAIPASQAEKNETATQKKKDPASTSATAKSNAGELSASADRLLSAVNGTVGQLLKPQKGAANPQAPADGSLPSPTAPQGSANSPAGAQDPMASDLQGPGLGNRNAGADLGLQAGVTSILDRDQLAGGGSQVDGRNPNETYSGGSDLMQGNPYSGMDRSAAGDKPSLPGQSPSPLQPDGAPGGGSSGASKETNEMLSSDFGFRNFVASKAGQGMSLDTAAFFYQQEAKSGTTGGAPAAGAPSGEGEGDAPKTEGSSSSGGSGGSGSSGGASGSGGTGGSGTSSGSGSGSGSPEGGGDGGAPAAGTPDPPAGGSGGSTEPSGGGSGDGEVSGGVPDAPPPDDDGMAGDRGEDSYEERDYANDFTNRYFEQKTQGNLGGSIDYGDGGAPQDASTSVGSNSDAYTANYGEGYRQPTEEELDAARQRAEGALDPSEEVNDR